MICIWMAESFIGQVRIMFLSSLQIMLLIDLHSFRKFLLISIIIEWYTRQRSSAYRERMLLLDKAVSHRKYLQNH